MRNPKTDFDAGTEILFQEILIHLGKEFRFVEIRFWVPRFIRKSEIRI